MPNDAKLGLVLGIALVIAIGVVFHRKDPKTALATSASAAPAAVTPAGSSPSRGQYRPARAKMMGETSDASDDSAAVSSNDAATKAD